ncbi:helicase/relaxase domain-containing protein [Coxiella burnetii]|uniref:Hypothetical cytosolic protein n=1 Tax=Coxiella burnetii (strain RSA 493 / Nine Mile phase I) TaxID=227377 RepID=Q83DY0_COXBU|nr:helicase/relaxase domain-containing protein [Coxiella burnetii]NP_819591.1 hypothetical protein CBU_0560 [Coxiella burnetii RSA 493]AAO90105.1 hypothetical cytosolic protein [Coxiella burnetii RSA 493]ARI65434.1 hypothetical protein B7L74_02910 [Coxiella burnetii]ARK26914.1 hypothetical protein BMW92_02825 [Coxiella burnetii]MCF2093140.1 DNA-binding domain-containing protein [Coxiella burnetii]MCF2095322.1 DNA-binding domain-containing protein [Coxiella burnetii]
MFIRSNHDQTSKNQFYKPGMLVPVFSAAGLLKNGRYQFLLQQIETLSLLPTEQYAQLYEALVYRFVEFVQVLPIRLDEPLCSLMNEGLLRGVNSLNHYIQNHPEATPLERYALFSAGLLLEVAHAVVNQKIFITDEEGNFIKQWNPFSGPLIDDVETKHYKIMPLSSYYQRNIPSITPILVRQLLPDEGFLWLTSDMRVFSDWMQALRDDEGEGGGRFEHVLQLFKHKNIDGLFNTLPALPVNLQDSPATAHADAFLNWLKEALATNQIKVNTSDAGVHVIPEGVFLEKTGIFKQYIDLHVNVPVNLFTVYQQFGNLFGLTKLSGIDYRFEQLFSEYPDALKRKSKMGFAGLIGIRRASPTREGVLIADPNLIFTRGEIPSATSYLKLSSAQKSQNIPMTPTSSVKPKIK